MTDTPKIPGDVYEEIYIGRHAFSNFGLPHYDNDIKYIRSDIHEALTRKAERLAALLKQHHDWMIANSPGLPDSGLTEYELSELGDETVQALADSEETR